MQDNMLSFLFWNIKKKRIGSLVASIAREQNIDVIVLAECDEPIKIIEELNASRTRQYAYHVDAVRRINIFSRFPSHCITSSATTTASVFES
jgi:hypothetical protein